MGGNITKEALEERSYRQSLHTGDLQVKLSSGWMSLPWEATTLASDFQMALPASKRTVRMETWDS